MRKAFFGILMAAAAAVPFAAQAQDSDGGETRAQARAEARAERAQERYQQAGERNQARYEQRQERVEQRQERVEQRQERQERVEQRQDRVEQRQDRIEQRQERVERTDSQRDGWQEGQQQAQQHRDRDGRNWGDRRGRGNDEALRRQIEASREASQRSADQTIGGNYARQAERNQRRYEERVRDQRYGGGRDGHRRDRWSDRRNGGSWNYDWRRDSRYDWQRHRYSNRNAFRWGSYYAPYRNYNYRRLSIGLFLDSLFYSNRYWLNDPWQYRLPPAPYGTRWVRYYDDVLLVDVYSGEVVDVIYDFFW